MCWIWEQADEGTGGIQDEFCVFDETSSSESVVYRLLDGGVGAGGVPDPLRCGLQGQNDLWDNTKAVFVKPRMP